MSELDRDRRRRAEVTAGHVLDEPDIPAEPEKLEGEERTLYLQHLFVHGLLESLVETDSGRATSRQEARLQAVMARIRNPEPRVKPSRSLFRYGAAAAVFLFVVVLGGVLIFSSRGPDAMAAINSALDRIDKGQDRHYRGEFVFDLQNGTRKNMKVEFMSGPHRFYIECFWPTPFGDLPFRAGCKGAVKWVDFMGMVFDVSEMRRPGSRFRNMVGVQHPSDFLGDVGAILRHMRQSCDLEMVRDKDGLLIVNARPRGSENAGDPGFPFPMANLIEMKIDEDTFEAKAIKIHAGGLSGPGNHMMPMKKLTVTFNHVKNFVAPEDVFLPAELNR